MENTLGTTEDWMEFYKTRQKELREKVKELDPHDKHDWMLIEVTDLDDDAGRLIRMLCKRTSTLIRRINRELSNLTSDSCGK